VTGVGKAVGITDVLVSEEIRSIRREHWSGVLAMTQGDVAKGLYFLNGDIAFAASTVEEDRLGANLFRIGRITATQFRTAMNVAREPERRLGQALIDAGVLSAEELAAAVTGQVERIVLSVLRWTGGRLQRRGMDRPLPADLVLDLNTPRLLLLGARVFPDARRLEATLGSPQTRLRRFPQAPFDYDAVPPSPVEQAVLALSVRETTLQKVLDLPHPRPQVVRAAYALVAGGILETARSPDDTDVSMVAPAERDFVPGGTTWTLEAADEAGKGAEGATGSAAPGPEEGERRARTLLENRQREAAVALLRATLERHPDATGCRRLLALTLAQARGFYAEVEQMLMAILKATPDDVELRYQLASYYRRAGMRARAMLQLRLVLSADPGHAAAWRDLGELEAGEGGQGR
jgi:tetratricopeptide (TPR) repeat protein